MRTDLLSILNDRIDRLHRHGRIEECAVVERAREQLFPTEKEGGHDSVDEIKRIWSQSSARGEF
jgi:hypothetical protein